MAKSKMSVKNLKIIQIGTTGTEVYATWSALSSTNQKYTKELAVSWQYQVKNSSGGLVWLPGSSGTVSKGATRSSGTYSAPAGALAAYVSVKPTLTSKGKKKRTSVAASASYSFAKNAPAKPSAPSVSVELYKLTASITTDDDYADHVKFFIYKEDGGVVASTPFASSGYVPISAIGTAQYVVDLAPGSKYYVTCRLYNETSGKYAASEESDPSVVSESAIPVQVTGVSVETISNNQVKLTWNAAAGAATENGYDIEYATKEEYFNTSNSQTTSASQTYAFITLDVGNIWYFRVRAKNSAGAAGAWSAAPYVSAAAAIKPNPPTTWSLKSSAMINDTLSLYWTHNSADGSKPTQSHLVWQINDGEAEHVYITHELGPDETDFTFHYDLTLDQDIFSDGDILKWKVSTTGIAAKGESDFSILREINVYAPVTVGLQVDSLITEYPLDITITAEPLSQSCVACYVNIIANSDYEAEDYMGKARYIHAGEAIYSEIFTNIGNELDLSLLPTDINLMDNQVYTVTVDVAMTSSLSGTASTEFTVDLEPLEFNVDAGIIIDPNVFTAAITPSCTYLDDDEEHPAAYRQCTVNDPYDEDEIYYIDDEGTEADPQPTEAEYNANPSLYYVIVPVLVSSVKMDVYRINFDGTFTEIATDLENTGSVMVSDPHPGLDNAKYRIIGHDMISGSLFYNDIISDDIDQTGLIIQWDEQYNDIFIDINIDDVTADAVGAITGGTTLILPYNVRATESNNFDVAIVEYIGRQSPTSYYGTQAGQGINLSADVDKEDTTTLELLRRLQVWPGDVYIREQNGLGYWANVTVSFNRDYDNLVMPVTIDARRVDNIKP